MLRQWTEEKNPIQSIPGVYTEERETKLILWICFVVKQRFSMKGFWETSHCQERGGVTLLGAGSLNAPKSSPK